MKPLVLLLTLLLAACSAVTDKLAALKPSTPAAEATAAAPPAY